MPALYIYPKDGEPTCFLLTDKDVSIGRSPDNLITIQDPFCSGQHALIHPTKDGFSILDNMSKNGTYLNGKRVVGEVPLTSGDEILIGSTRIYLDKKMSTNVELIEIPDSSPSINAVMPISDVLQKKEEMLDIQSIKSEVRLYSVVSEISKALVIHMPLGDLLEHIMDLISDHLPMDRGIMMLQEGNPAQLIPRAVRVGNPGLQNFTIQVSQSIVKMVVEGHSSVLISDVQADPHLRMQESIVSLNIHSAMCVPLWNEKKIIGLIYADRISIEEAFSEDDLKLLTFLSNLAAIKIENAKLIEQVIEKEKMDKELALAAQIQKDFLPSENPADEVFDIAGANAPCYQVGGDYYDFISIDEGRLACVIADVAGKGVSASLLMASLRAALYSDIHSHPDPVQMVSRLNAFVNKSSAINHFITFFYCEITRGGGELIYVNAGHNPPMVIGKKGHLRRLESSGFCLGMFPEAEYSVGCIKLKPGEILVMFTDGITEARDKHNKEFGEERLIRICRKQGKLPAGELLENIYSEVREFSSGRDPEDDMTLIIVKS